MCRKQQREFINPQETQISMIPKIYSDYEPRKIRNMIKRYSELRSVVEIVSTQYEYVSVSGTKGGKEELLCSLVDMDEAINQLSPGQQIVIRMLKMGYKEEEICSYLGISINTVRTYTRRGICRMTTYLNSQ